MLTLDFGTLPVQAAGPVDSLPDLVIVAHYKNKDDMLCHLFLDCVPLVEQHESKDWNFVISTLTDLFTSGFFTGYTKLLWWSDTGPAHFRTSNTLFELRRLQSELKIEICVHFFAPRHGHSQCDGHIGVISRTLRHKAQDLHDTVDEWNREWVLAHMSKLKATSQYFIDIQRKPKIINTVAGTSVSLVWSFDIGMVAGAHVSLVCLFDALS